MIYHNTTAIDAVNDGKDTPDAFYHKSTLIATSEYIHTDGWRGYTKMHPAEGYKLIEGDWMTGDWDDAPEGHSSREVEAKIRDLETQYGDVYVIFAPTSNVFSTSYAVIVKDPDAKPFDKGKPIAHKTRRFDSPDGSFRVRYQATDVVKYDAATDTYTLNTGDWNTMTTAKRMTDALPDGWHVYRRNWMMMLHRPGENDVEIKDGMEVKA